MADPDKFEQLASCSDRAFEEFYQIYAESIAQRERKTKTWICEMTNRSDYRIFLLKQGGKAVGFSILFLPERESFALLEYMAVAAEHRNAGLGSEVFKRSIQSVFPRTEQMRPILLEVDSDREESSDRTLRARRQQFYRRLGCLRFAGFHYLLPLPGDGPPPAMDLMIYPAGDQRHIFKSDLKGWLRTIYQSVYNCSPEDPRITQMLEGVSEPARLE